MKNRYLLLKILLCCLVPAWAQQPNVLQFQEQTIPSTISTKLSNFRYLTVNDGFSRNSVFKIMQDSKGFMWFGLWDGLYRYDGSKVKHVVYTHSEEGTRNEPNVFLSDGLNRIWIGRSSGILIWDAEHQKKIPFQEKTEKGESIEGFINDLCKDNQGNIWIISQKKNLFLYQLKSKKLKKIPILLDDTDYHLDQIYIDRDKNIWITTNKGALQLKNEQTSDGDFFNCHNWKITRSRKFKIFENQKITQMYQDTHRNYWLGTSQGIVRVSDGANDSTISIDFIENMPSGNRKIRVNAITESNSKIYAATNQGLLTYDLRKQEAVWNLPDYTEEHHLSDRSLTDIFIDKENGIWISSFYGGVNYFHHSNNNFLQYDDLNKQIEGHIISGITEDKRGNIWMAVEDNGICLWNRQNNTIENFNNNSSTTYHPTYHNVQSILAEDDYLYVGMFNNGMDVMNLNNGEFFNLNFYNTRPDPLGLSVYAFHPLNKGQLLVGTNNGLYRVNINKRESHKIKNVEGKVNCIAVDEAGDYWISTLKKGFYWFCQDENKWKHFIQLPNDSIQRTGNDITTLLPMNSSIYVGTQGNGLWVLNKATSELRQIAPRTLGKSIIFKVIAKGQELWITTNQGLYAYNISNRHLKQYTVLDGLRCNQFKENSGILTSDNGIVLGGLDGFNFFKPVNLNNNNTLPEVMMTDFYLFNRSADIHDPDCPLKQSITYTEKIDLNQKHHSFAFKFSSSSYCDPSKNKFEYKLEPFEKEWQRTHGNNKMVSYTNLPAGKYVFHVRTSNGEGNWSDEKCIEVNIHPYWWLNWPMQLLYLLIFIGFIGNLIHRYRKKRREEMRLFRIAKEQEVYESKMNFFTCMVHEIRTPLTLILGPLNSVMKKEEQTVAQVLPDLQIVKRNGHRLLSLVNQLMDFRKVEEKSYSIRLQPVNIGEMLRQAVREFVYYSEQKAVNIDIHLPEDNCWAEVDREAFSKVVNNLLSNAIKFTRDSIVIHLRHLSTTDCWELSIQDNGKGIAKKEQQSIFESFYQVHQDLPSDFVGTGIGLFVVRKLMQLQGGDIRVESEPGKGACFIATMKCAKRPLAEATPQATSTVQPQDADNAQHDLSNNTAYKRILVAEDNEEMRRYIASLFTDNYEVDTFENGEKALLATKEKDYDVVITDLMMPILDGMSLCRTLKQQPATSHIPIIILTAKDDENSEVEGFESDADMYVTKPFSAEILKSRVKSILHNRERLYREFYAQPETTTELLLTNQPDKDFLKQLDELIDQRLSDCNIPVDELAYEMAMGRSVFYKKVKGVTGLTPNDYIRTFRLKKAVYLFQNGETRINEVCYRVGFSSPSYFTKRFTQQFGISPSDFLKKAHGLDARENNEKATGV